MLKKAEELLLFLTVFLIPTQLGKHFWPDFSFVYSLPIDYLSPTLYLWDVLVILLCIVFIIRKEHINRKAINLFYFFILVEGLSLLVSQNIGAGLVRLEQYLVAGLFGVYIASSDLSKIKSILFWGLSLSVLMESAISILQFIKAETLGLWFLGERTFSISTPGIAKFDFKGIQFLRPYGTFPHPNVLAGFMIIMPVILTAIGGVSRETKDIYSSLAFRMTVLFAGITTILSVSRVAILIGYLVAAFLLSRKWKMILVAVVLILLPFIFIRFSSIFTFDNLTILRREELAEDAWKMFTNSPILGIGLNNFIQVSAQGLVSGPSRFLQPVHNVFLLSLSETGIIGLAGLLITFGYPIWRVRKVKNLLIIWTVVIFLGMFDHYFLTLPQGYRLLFLIWGLSFSAKII